MSIGGGWERVRSDVLTCDSRNKRGPLPLQACRTGSPMGKKSYSDYLSTLPRTEVMNEYILMMEDSFTKWVDWCPSPPKPQNLQRAAINSFFVRFRF